MSAEKDSEGEASSRKKTLVLVVAAFVAGMLFNTWRMVRVPIDEYHEVRMDIEEKLDEMEELLDE